VICIAAYIYIIKNYSLKKIQVTGNVHYTSDEIIDIVTKGKETDNTLVFYYDYKLNPVENVTFIDKFKIEVIDKHTVTITVYEKSMAGCVMYMDQYVYFDNDGTVLETSEEKLLDVPCIDGLTFSSIVVGEKLPVKNKSLFQQILTMTQLIDKNELLIDEIRFNSSEEILLYKDDIKIELGDGTNLEDKLMNLDSILEKIQGKKGTLDLKDYTAANGNAIFKENK
jgi:cell division septal protein FtsQ